MRDCCDDGCTIDTILENQRGTLHIVLIINGIMFLVIAAAALYSKSTALLADRMDNLGDSSTYGLSLYAVLKGSIVKARVALFKGCLIFLAACAVISQIVYKFYSPEVPFLRSWDRSAF